MLSLIYIKFKRKERYFYILGWLKFWKVLEFEPFLLSFKLALITSVSLFIISLPLAWYLSQTKSKFKPVIEAFTAMPIVLPPSVLGFYLLVILSPDSFIGTFIENYFGIKPLFSFEGLILASCFYSLPFMIQPIQSGFEGLNPKSNRGQLFKWNKGNLLPSLELLYQI